MPQTIEGAFAQGAKEMIVVLPDSKTRHNGSMYSSSVTTGDFERFIARDVVSYIDAHYRTIPNRLARGLVGHSMGGYGATRIGMKHADVFGSLYIMSPCCLSPRQAATSERGNGEDSGSGEDARRFCQVAVRLPVRNSPPQLPGRPIRKTLRCTSTWRGRLANCSRMSWRNGRRTRHWLSLTNISAIYASIVRFRWMWVTRTGYELIQASCTMCLISMESRNGFEVYQGTHTSAVAVRFQNFVLPFFSKNLCFGKDCK